jgi:two-component system, OmpR family, sensor histidine kinase BaeS
VSAPRERRTGNLTVRLLLAQLLVLAAGAVTAWVVTVTTGPPLFHEHLRRAGVAASPAEVTHAEEAFRSATVISLTVALLAALAAALAVSIYVTRRVGRSVAAVAAAATDVAAGHYEARVPPAGLGEEFDELGGAFNAMAVRLGTVEQTRTRLLADLAHELRTPVATLDAYLEGVEDGVAVLDADTVAILRQQTSRLARLASDVGAVSSAEEHGLDLRARRTSPEQIARAAAATAADRYAAKGVDLQVVIAPATPAAEADTDRMAQVLGNLLDNALRHTPSGGRVTVSVEPRSGGTALVVSDDGEGITAEHLPHVFERFYRADADRSRASGGSGLGLAIAKVLTDAHGGRISVSSDGAGKGASFTVWLPAAG